MRSTRNLLVEVVAVLVALGSVTVTCSILLAGEPGSQLMHMQSALWQPAPLSGQVLFPDATSPAGGVPVRMWSVAERRFIYETVTDAEGAYSLPAVGPGRYWLVFGDKVTVDVEVSEEGKDAPKTFTVIIPRGSVALARMPAERWAAVLEATAAPEGGSLLGGLMPKSRLMKSVLVVGGGSATAVGVAVAVKSDNDHKKVVSP